MIFVVFGSTIAVPLILYRILTDDIKLEISYLRRDLEYAIRFKAESDIERKLGNELKKNSDQYWKDENGSFHRGYRYYTKRWDKKTKKTISKWMSINDIRQEIENQEALLSRKRVITIAVWVILSIIGYLFTDI